uniref:Uncharacterized protein n=1 Tax=viral metagenome TaxID=1070528 RepID=A0A6C0DY09_9ZZZZ
MDYVGQFINPIANMSLPKVSIPSLGMSMGRKGEATPSKLRTLYTEVENLKYGKDNRNYIGNPDYQAVNIDENISSYFSNIRRILPTIRTHLNSLNSIVNEINNNRINATTADRFAVRNIDHELRAYLFRIIKRLNWDDAKEHITPTNINYLEKYLNVNGWIRNTQMQ